VIIPGILTDNLEEAQARLDALAALSPRPEAVQIDLLDGFFADELTIEPAQLKDLDRHGLPLDAHLMVVEPANFLGELVGTDGLRAVIAQVERLPDQREFVELAKQNKWLAGLSLNLYTPLEAVDEEIWGLIDILQVMGGAAGSQGQDFHPAALALIRDAAQARLDQGLAFHLMVDVGMRPETIALAKEAGADDFVVGSFLNEKMQQHWQELQRSQL
jgi:ribulose-phosphate 3-epimerase